MKQGNDGTYRQGNRTTGAILMLFRVNTVSPTYKGNIVKIGDVIRGHKIVGFTHSKSNPKIEKVTTKRAIYAIGEKI